MEKNANACPEMYHCAICGNGYENVEERAECEAKCIKERKEAEAKKKQLEHEAARTASEEAICMALADINEMIAEHLRKYESLMLKSNYPYLRYLFKNNIGWWF